MMKPPVLIPHASGTNRDLEAAQAIEAAGGDPRIVHVNALRCGAVKWSEFAAILLPGGFSYGDSLGAGGRLALELRTWFAPELSEAVRSGRPILGICNGFQALVKAGLLGGSDRQEGRGLTLTHNAAGRFECRWVTLGIEPSCRSSWLGAIAGTVLRCPVAHGEGRIAVSGPEVVDSMTDAGLVAFRYLDSGIGASPPTGPALGEYPANPNGSVADIAGICDATGTVVGLMPHPEDHIFDWQRPSGDAGASGLPLFQAFVEAAR